MVNTLPSRYPVQLGPTVSVEVDAELTAWSALLGQSKSTSARECLEDGLPRLRAKWRRRAAAVLGLPADSPELTERFESARGQAVAEAEDRAEKQKTRRADYERRTRLTVAEQNELAAEGGPVTGVGGPVINA